MKLIYLTANLPHGGNEAFIIPEIEALVRMGHEILLIPRSPTGRIVHGEALVKWSRCQRLLSSQVVKTAVHRAAVQPSQVIHAASGLIATHSASQALKNLAVFPKALWLAEVAVNWGANHIHCHWASTTATMALITSRLSGIPWSITAHRWDIVENNLLSAKAKEAGFVRLISEDGLRLADAAGADLGAKAKLLRMGVRIPAMAPTKSSGMPVVLCPARLAEVKGHRFLIQAWSDLKASGVSAQLWLAGDGELRPRIEAQIRELGLEDDVKMLGALPHEHLLKIYADGQVSAVVLPSIDLGNGFHEGVPVALIEAMSYAIPVVAAASGAIRELVLPGTGLLVEPGNAASITRALQGLLSDPALRDAFGREGRRHVSESYDIDRVARELTSAFLATRASDASFQDDLGKRAVAYPASTN